MGVVQPKDVSKTYEDSGLLDKIKGLISGQNKDANSFDNTGVVNALSENMENTKTSDKVADKNSDVVKEPVVEKAAEVKISSGEKGNMGIVQPKADMGTQKVPNEAPKSTSVKSSEKGNMGVVQPPKNEIKPDATGINFDRYKTDNIKKSPFKKK